MSRFGSLLHTLGLDKRDRQGWVLFDFGDNAFSTVVLAVILPVYYVEVAGADLPENLASVYWSYTVAVSFTIIAVSSPVLGAVADHLEKSREFLASFTILGVVFTGALFFTGEGDWLLTSVLFVFANIGFAGARLFYNSLLPGITDGETIDRVSTAGYALGYIGGSLLLVFTLAMVLSPSTFGLPDTETASRVGLFVAAVWWAVFAIPLFIYVPEPEREPDEFRDEVKQNPVVSGFKRLKRTYGEVRTFRYAFIFLVAFWFYNNGINAIITLAAAYASEIGLDQSAIILAVLIVQVVGIPCAFAFGRLADVFSTKNTLFLGLGVYTLISIIAVGVTEAWHFYALAVLLGTVQGGTQALSRSMFGSLIPRHKSAEFFSFFAIVAGFASVAGPLMFGVVGQITGSVRLAILSLAVFFVVGTVILMKVDVDEGRTVARKSTPSSIDGTRLTRHGTDD